MYIFNNCTIIIEFEIKKLTVWKFSSRSDSSNSIKLELNEIWPVGGTMYCNVVNVE